MEHRVIGINKEEIKSNRNLYILTIIINLIIVFSFIGDAYGHDYSFSWFIFQILAFILVSVFPLFKLMKNKRTGKILAIIYAVSLPTIIFIAFFALGESVFISGASIDFGAIAFINLFAAFLLLTFVNCILHFVIVPIKVIYVILSLLIVIIIIALFSGAKYPFTLFEFVFLLAGFPFLLLKQIMVLFA